MTTAFGPIGDSDVISITAASQRFELGSLASSNAAIRLIALNANQQAWYLKFGDNAVTVSVTDGMRAIPASQDAPLVLPVPSGATHVAILAEGATGDAQLSYGGFREGQFLPLGASSTTAISQTDQRIALPTLESGNPSIRLVSKNPSIASLYVKLGDGTVTGSVSTSMRVAPGSVENPTIIPVTNSETHLSIFCEGVGGDVVLTGGGLQAAEIRSSDVLFSAGPRILARDSGAGAGQERTISQVLDYLGGAAQGDVIYRGASDWNNLAAGVSGQFLQTLGNAADPVWADLPDAGLVLLTSGTVSAAATLDLVLTSYTAYRGILFNFSAFVPATDSVSFQARVSSDGGASYNAGATDYRYTSFGSFDDSSTTTSATRSTGGSSIAMTNGTVGNVASSEGIEGFVWLLNQTATGRHSRLHWDINAILENGVAHRCSGVGRRQTSQDTDAMRFLFSSGNIASGNYAVYGLS
jgi:hypothetical protein